MSKKINIESNKLYPVIVENSTPSDDILERILKNFKEINPDWLHSNRGSMLIGSVSNREAEEQENNRQYNHLVKNEILRAMDNTIDYHVLPMLKDSDFILTLRTNEMTPRYAPGDMISGKWIDDYSFIPYGKVFYIITDLGMMLRKLMPSEKEDHLRAVAYNEKEYPPVDIPTRKIKKLALVTGCVKLD